MYTSDVDWSPSINLNELHEGNQQKVQERADRAIFRKRKCEDKESEVQLMEQEFVKQESIINDKAQDKNVISRLKLTRKICQLTFLVRDILLVMIKYVTHWLT